MDTIAKDSVTKIIIYTNNTWSYYRPSLKVMDVLPVYRDHWDTSQVFAYRSVELKDLPAVIELPLITSFKEYHYPIRGRVFSKYGPRGRRNHNGVDIPLKTGEPIYAVFDGRVRYAKYNTGGFGNLVIVRHTNGLETWNAHLTKLNVKPNDYVKAGQVIGFGGSTGRSRGPHLHFETRYADQTFDPERLIDFETGSLRYQTFALERSYFNIHSRASDQLEEDDDAGTDAMAALLAESGEGESASEDILEKIAKAQQKPATVSSQSTSGAVYHTVRQGDMLGSISRKYGVSIDQICRLNPGLTRTTILKLGRRLRVK
jgi:LysM repeat protein